MDTSLTHFLADLALDPAKLATYLADPEAFARTVGLDPASQDALRAGDPAAIFARLRAEDARQDPLEPWNCPRLFFPPQ